MNVLFISQCRGNALIETRRILDQFAERRGERSWLTPITWEGLKTVHRLLRRTARKNTAVACFWLHRNRSELLWIVGDRRQFNECGATPTNVTGRDLLDRCRENDWHHGEVIRLLAGLASLFHDFGKANALFQKKLRQGSNQQDPLRHEWISLRLFAAFVGDGKEDRVWLERLADPDFDWDWQKHLVQDGIVPKTSAPLKTLPPLARAVGWLILTHHRLPLSPEGEFPRSKSLKAIERLIKDDWGYGGLGKGKRKACEKDEVRWKDSKSGKNRKQSMDLKKCWNFEHGLPFASRHWRERAAQLARRLLNYPEIFRHDWLDRPFPLHLARLVLMLADHYYSAQPSKECYGDRDFPLYANTEKGQLKQRLDEHLIGVEISASRIARILPKLADRLPRIACHCGFKHTRGKPFLWQNRAFGLAESLRSRVAKHGFFGINMASTGCGKTLANGRILYALADPKLGARFTIALGLRVLTLQTGDAYRDRLGLGPEDLAVLVGGSAVRALHEQRRWECKDEEMQERLGGFEGQGILGSESSEALLEEGAFVHFKGSLEDGPLNRWLENQPRAFLQAPIVVCTVDHLTPATEGVQGGRQILPMLRLLTSDLVLDEVDDFELRDLPAITRLVHWAGMLGSRVLLSSATLPPSLVQGLFQAYLKGREAYQMSCGEPGLPVQVCCAWFDEFSAQASDHGDLGSFRQAHDEFVEKRLKRLSRQPPCRRAQIQPLDFILPKMPKTQNDRQKQELLCQELAKRLPEWIFELHERHHQVDPKSQKRVSIGLVRMANIDPLVTTARFLAEQEIPEGKRLHLCIYHARFPLFLRSHIETRLDRLLKRHRPEALFEDEEMRERLRHFEELDQIFIVLASPVAEVGRDHDYDWAIVEPSSIRSIIQLAGRVRRHRHIARAPDVTSLLTEEARLTKKLFALAAKTVGYGEFKRRERGSGTDLANRFLDHGNYLAYGLGAVATWVLGLPHGLAVLHGKTRRGGLVFDTADLVKDATILPQAFLSAMAGHSGQEFRQACINALVTSEALDFMIDTLKEIAAEFG